MNPKKSNNVLQISIALVCGVQPLRYTSTFGVLVFQICSCCSGRERINIPEERHNNSGSYTQTKRQHRRWQPAKYIWSFSQRKQRMFHILAAA